MKDTRLVVRISTDELDNIKKAAKKSGRNFSEYVLNAVRVQMGELNSIETRITRLESVLSK